MRSAVLALLLLSCCFLHANLAVNQPFAHVQADGSKLQLFVSGDEFYRRVHDKDNYTIMLDPDSGNAVYALPSGSGLRTSAYVVGKANPLTLGIQPGLMRDDAITRAIKQKHQDALGTPGDRAPSTGTVNNIFVFVRFDDQSEYTQALSTYDSITNSTTSSSMRDYFSQESSNQLTISTTFYPAAVGGIVRSFQDSHDRGDSIRNAASSIRFCYFLLQTLDRDEWCYSNYR